MASAGNDLRSSMLGGRPLLKNQTTRDGVSTTIANKFQHVGAMRTALLTAGYTAAQLDVMTQNDMVYALKGLNGLL